MRVFDSYKNQQDVKSQLFICKKSDGRDVYLDLKLNVGGMTLASLEPFETPVFAASDPAVSLVAVFDIAAFLGEGDPFTTGESVVVMNGLVAQTTIQILDATGLISSDPLVAIARLADDAFLQSLPPYTGSATVARRDSFVPESGSIALFGIGTAALFGMRKRRRLRSIASG